MPVAGNNRQRQGDQIGRRIVDRRKHDEIHEGDPDPEAGEKRKRPFCVTAKQNAAQHRG